MMDPKDYVKVLGLFIILLLVSCTSLALDLLLSGVK